MANLDEALRHDVLHEATQEKDRVVMLPKSSRPGQRADKAGVPAGGDRSTPCNESGPQPIERFRGCGGKPSSPKGLRNDTADGWAWRFQNGFVQGVYPALTRIDDLKRIGPV